MSTRLVASLVSFIIYPSVSLAVGLQNSQTSMPKKKEATRSNKKPKWIAKPKQLKQSAKIFPKGFTRKSMYTSYWSSDWCHDVVSKVASLLDSVALDVIKGDVTWQPRWHCQTARRGSFIVLWFYGFVWKWVFQHLSNVTDVGVFLFFFFPTRSSWGFPVHAKLLQLQHLALLLLCFPNLCVFVCAAGVSCEAVTIHNPCSLLLKAESWTPQESLYMALFSEISEDCLGGYFLGLFSLDS